MNYEEVASQLTDTAMRRLLEFSMNEKFPVQPPYSEREASLFKLGYSEGVIVSGQALALIVRTFDSDGSLQKLFGNIGALIREHAE